MFEGLKLRTSTLVAIIAQFSLLQVAFGESSNCDRDSGSPFPAKFLTINTKAIEDHLNSPIPTLESMQKPIAVTPQAYATIEKEWTEYQRYKSRYGQRIAMERYGDRFPTVAKGLQGKKELFEPRGFFDKIYTNYKRENGVTDNSRIAAMGEKSKYMMLLAAATMGGLKVLPPDFTNWHDDWEDPGKSYVKHVKRGPVMDGDSPIVNWVGHPYSGAAYYVMARETGFSAAESAVFSFLMSTFFWEYGFEAVAETPSIQDLIITPGVGSLIGEAMWQGYKRLENGGTLGAKWLDETAKFVLNPAGSVVNALTNGTAAAGVETRYIVERQRPDRDGTSGTFFGLRMNWKY